MNVFTNIDDISFNKNTVITVGTFDGVHTGHNFIISSLLDEAKKSNDRDLLITFDPHPRHVLQNNNLPNVSLLTTIEERIALFKQKGISNILIIPFTKKFANTKPEEFIRSLLVQKIGMSKMIIGYDHFFGSKRSGNFSLLEQLGEELNFEPIKVDAHYKDQTLISSTKIRNAIKNNMIEFANSMLGYQYHLSGTITKGQGKATGFGFPTANFGNVHPLKELPSNGVYLVSSIIAGQKYFGMANCGNRPTINSSNKQILEVHYFNFSDDLYQTNIEVNFINFIRNEKKFDSIEQLIEQIHKDKIHCEDLIKNLWVENVIVKSKF